MSATLHTLPPRQTPRRDWLAVTDIAALERHAALLRAERDAAERRIAAADTGEAADYPAFDAASQDFDRIDDELLLVDRRIDEIEEEAEWDAVREQRRDFWAGVL